MIDEINKDDAQASEDQENLENESDETTEEESEEESQEIDYKAELEALKEAKAKTDKQLGQAEHTIEKIKKENRETPQEDIEKLIEMEIAKRFEGVEKTALKSAAEQMASSIARNGDEAALILHHYENSIRTTGDLRTDIELAQVLANRKRVAAELQEVKRALSSPKAEKGGGSGIKQQRSQAPKLSPKEASFIKSANMRWNAKNSRYEGKHVALSYDQETKSWQSIRLEN